MKKTLYHGTNNWFDEFSNDYISTETSTDQYGSGFYFYDVPAKTTMHGDLRITVEAEITKATEYTKRNYFSKDFIESLIIKSPNLEYRLADFGDIEWEGFDKILKMAVNSYTGKSFYIDILNTIGNDFYEGNETYVLLNEFIKLTGINCIKDSERGIYVILSKKFIEIKSIKHEQST